MPRAKQLTIVEKAKIEALYQAGWSFVEIARELNRSEAGVRHVINKGHGYYIKKRPGRKKKLSAADKRRIDRYFSHADVSLRAATTDLHLNVSWMTVHRAIKKNPNLRYQKMKTAPALTDVHKRNRLEFLQKNLQRDWKK